ncbi:MAG: hypothetical protein IJW32_03385 [Clostridia bacterium]|nr:hypothetical protein [Clostridia bacterium]
MSASLVGIIITALIGVILVSSIFFGAKRGLKKTLFRFVWLIITFIAVYFTTPLLSNWLNSFDISSFNLDVYGPVNKLSDIGANIVNELAKTNEAFADSAALKSFAENLPTMVLNVFLFVIAFWLLKALLYPIWALIASRLFDKQEREQKKFKKQQAKLRKQNNGVQPPQDENMPILLQVKKKKTRWGGAVIGLFIGLLLCAATFSPIVGLNALYQNAYASMLTEKDGEQVSLIESSIEDEEVLNYLSCYEDSIGSKILTYTGMGFLSNAMFSGLATVEVENEKVYLSDEIDMAIKVYNRYDSIKTFNTDNLTQESLNKVLNAAKGLFDDIRNSKLIYLLGDDLLPYLLDDLISAEDFKLIDGGEFDDILISALKTYVVENEKFKLANYEPEIESVVDIALALNNSNLIIPFIEGEIETFDDFVYHVAANVKTGYLPENIVDNLYNVSMLKKEYPGLVDKGIKALYETLGITYSKQVLSNSNLQEDLKTILGNTIDFIKLYAESDNFDFGDKTAKATEYLGQVLDVLKTDILGESNYQSLITFAVDNINEATSSFADFSEITANLHNVEQWSNLKNSNGQIVKYGELYVLTNLYKHTIKLINDGVTFDKILEEDYSLLANIGEGINSALAIKSQNKTNASKIITNKTLRRALEIVLDKIDTTNFEEVLNVEVAEGLTLKNAILNNIYNPASETDNTISSSVITDWKQELNYNLKVFRKAYAIVVDNFNLEELSRQNNTQLSDLGLAIDEAIDNTQLLLNNQVIRSIAAYYLDQVEFGEDVDEILNIEFTDDVSKETISVYNKVLNNIYDKDHPLLSENISWQNEFSKIKNVINATFDTTDLVALGRILDGVANSRVLSQTVINEVVKKYIDDEVVSLPLGLSKGIETMKKNLTNVVSYEDEFRYITQLIDVITATYDTDKQKFAAMGAKFNEICDIQQSIGENSKLITKTVINQFIEHYFDTYMDENLDTNADAKLIALVDEIKTNLPYVRDYQTELTHILDLVDCVDGTIPDKNGDSANDLKDIGRVLDAITNNSNIITTEIVRDIVNYYIDKETTTLDANLITIIDKIKANISDVNINLNQKYEIEFGFLQDLTTHLSEETIDMAELGATFDLICNASGNQEAVSSVIISRAILNEMLCYYFDDYVTTKLSSTDDAALIEIINDIKTNVDNIESYQTEFTHLDNLFAIINNESITEIGTALDLIKDNSELITNQNLNDIVIYFFDEEAKEYADDEDYGDIIALMKAKVESCKDAEGAVYNSVFTELDKILLYIVDFEAVTNAENFTNPESIGTKLDELEDMSYACDATITKACAQIIINKISATEILKTAVDAVLTHAMFDFANYNTAAYAGEHPVGENYYKDLMTAINTAIESLI